MSRPLREQIHSEWWADHFHSQNSEQSHRLDRLSWLHTMATFGTHWNHYRARLHLYVHHARNSWWTIWKCTWWWWAHHNIKCLRSDKCIIWYVWGPEISYKFWKHTIVSVMQLIGHLDCWRQVHYPDLCSMCSIFKVLFIIWLPSHWTTIQYL